MWQAIVALVNKAAYWIASRLMVAGVNATLALAAGYVVAGSAALAAGNAVMGRLTNIPEIGLGQQGMSILSNAPFQHSTYTGCVWNEAHWRNKSLCWNK